MNKSLITGLLVGGVAVTGAGAFAGYKAMDNRRSAEVLNVEQLTRTVRTPRQVCSDEIVTSQAPKDPKRVTGAVVGAGDREGTVRMDDDPGRSIPVENGELVLTSLVDRQ
jgi:uncharacterized protein YcfJ